MFVTLYHQIIVYGESWSRKNPRVSGWIKLLSETESTGEGAVKTVEMTTRALECYINVIFIKQEGLRGLTLILKEVLWVKCYQPALHATVKSFMKMEREPEECPES